ncbi:MAG: hypothetical protein AAF960_18780, partial [Bacteroidota bacterium]
IFVYADSDDGFLGFSLVINGKVARFRYYNPNSDLISSDDFGTHGKEEIEFHNQLSKQIHDEDNAFYDKHLGMMVGKIYPTNQTYHYHYLDSRLTDAIMEKHLGFNLWSLDRSFGGYVIELQKSIDKYFNF